MGMYRFIPTHYLAHTNNFQKHLLKRISVVQVWVLCARACMCVGVYGTRYHNKNLPWQMMTITLTQPTIELGMQSNKKCLKNNFLCIFVSPKSKTKTKEQTHCIEIISQMNRHRQINERVRERANERANKWMNETRKQIPLLLHAINGISQEISERCQSSSNKRTQQTMLMCVHVAKGAWIKWKV